MNEPSNARTAAAITANRLRPGGRAMAGQFIATSNLRAPGRATVAANNSTKVRPVADATKLAGPRLLHADGTAGSACCDDHAATADLSDSKHEDFDRSSGTPAQPTCAPRFSLTIFSIIFFDMRRSDTPTLGCRWGECGEHRRSSRPLLFSKAKILCAARLTSTGPAKLPRPPDCRARRFSRGQLPPPDRDDTDHIPLPGRSCSSGQSHSIRECRTPRAARHHADGRSTRYRPNHQRLSGRHLSV